MATGRLGRMRIRAGAIPAAALLLGMAAATPARAQFNFFGAREATAEDVSDTIAEHGFRLVGPLYRNGRVYLADVIDRRDRRERLVISAETGQIVQRYMIDLGPQRRPAPPVAATAKAQPQDDSFFSHLTRGWGDDPPPRPPLGLDGAGGDQAPVQVPRRSQPKVVTRTEPPPTPVTASPLPAPAASAPASKPDVVSVPAPSPSTPAATAPASVRATSVATDPLRIPGARPAEDRKAPAAVAAKAAEPSPAPTVAKAPEAAVPKPKVPAAPTTDVPVAPLE